MISAHRAIALVRAFRYLQAKNHGIAPTYRELAKSLGMTAGAVHKQVEWLILIGWMTKPVDQSSRGLVLLKQDIDDNEQLPNPVAHQR